MSRKTPLLLALVCGAVCVGACVLKADPVSGPKGDPGPPGEAGVPDTSALATLQGQVEALQAATNALQASNATLQAKVDALEKQIVDADCPSGYTPASTPPAAFLPHAIVCIKGVDEIVKVGTSGSAFWVDRYEATLWDNVDGSGMQRFVNGTDDSSVNFPKNGQATVSLYALSVKARNPARMVTWFQAMEACAASGKRLPTGSEWLRAARRTTDSGAVDGSSNDKRCNTQSTAPRPTGNGVGATEDTSCISYWGAEDMIGNVYEWTDEWHAGLGDASAQYQGKQSWPDDATHPYGQDGTWNIASSAETSGAGAVPNLPAVGIRGGGWADGVRGGVFSLVLSVAPSNWAITLGFRCLLPR